MLVEAFHGLQTSQSHNVFRIGAVPVDRTRRRKAVTEMV